MNTAAHDIHDAPTRLDPASAQLAAEAARRTANLQEGSDVSVPTGTETSAVHVNALDAIKAMYKKSRELREAENAGHADPGRDPLRPTDDPLARGPRTPDTQTNPPQDAAHATPTNPAPTPATVAANPPLTNPPEYVSVTFQGRQITVSKRDIERAGGPDAYLRARQLEAEQDMLAQERMQIQQARAELDVAVESMRRLQAELAQSQTAGHGSPATVPGAVPGRSDPATGLTGNDTADIQAQAERLASMLYSGDPDDAKNAVQTLLAEARAARQAYSAEQIAQQAAALMRAADAQRAGPTQQTVQQPPAPPPVNPLFARINAMADAEFPSVVADPVQRAAALALLQQRAGLRENQDRSAVDIAREVCEEIEMIYSNPRKGIVEVKRGLPAVPQAAGTAPAPTQPKTMSASEWVAHVARSRKFDGQPPI